jgi:GTP-binding protein Era
MSFKFGYVALIGKPNVGKSTLMNWIVGQKVSIVSNKPQTTRRRVIGIAQSDDYQIAFVDTPGIHEPHTRLGRAMVESARGALSDVDLILYVADVSHKPNDEDREIARLLKQSPIKCPILVCLNKMDRLKAEFVVQNVDEYCSLLNCNDYMLTAAIRGNNVDKILDMILERLPEGEPVYGPDDFTDQSSRFMTAELVREKILIATRQEIPHATAVSIDDWQEPESGTLRISASIYVEKQSQRAILIGKQGQFVKNVGTLARAEIEALLGRPVFLELYVKVRADWRMNPRMLHEMEYLE